VILDHLLGIYAALAGLNAPVLDLELIQYLRLVDSSTLRAPVLFRSEAIPTPDERLLPYGMLRGASRSSGKRPPRNDT
jgi:hypothetical protein